MPQRSQRASCAASSPNAGSVTERVCGELHVTKMLVELLEDMDHDGGVRRIAAKQKLSAALVGTFTGIETSEVSHDLLHGVVDQYMEVGERRGLGKLRVPISMARKAERDVPEPELGHTATVDDERSDCVRLRAERSLVDEWLTQAIGKLEHLRERVTEVGLTGRGAELHDQER
jgi:hypothetical protein